jgi:solute carrier family 9B (sodium/hydrogen exchanger), member 1/2
VLPQLIEALILAILLLVMFDMPFFISLAVGSMAGAVSPAVVVSAINILQNKGFGEDKGIGSIVIAACSLDDVLAISSKIQTYTYI